MAGQFVILLLAVSCVTFLQGVTANAPYTWNVGHWMQKLGEDKWDKQTNNAIEQLTNEIRELQETCKTGKEVSHYEEKINELNKKFDIWKLKLENVELRIKDEIRQEYDAESALRCSTSTLLLENFTLRVEAKLMDACRNESFVYGSELKVCLLKVSDHEIIKDDLIKKLEKENERITNLTKENKMLKDEISNHNKTKINIQIQLDKCNNTTEVLQTNLSELSSQINISKLHQEEAINKLQITRNDLSSLNINLESCKADLTRYKSEAEIFNVMVKGIQKNLADCSKTSEDRRQQIEVCTNQALAGQSVLLAINKQLEDIRSETDEEKQLRLKRLRSIPYRDQLARESNGKVFKIGDKEKVVIMKSIGWQSASDICTSIGMKLVSFQTKEKWVAVKSYLDNNGFQGKWFWTSGRSNRGEWWWSASNEVLSFAHWTRGKPDFRLDSNIRFYTAERDWETASYNGGDTNNIICE